MNEEDFMCTDGPFQELCSATGDGVGSVECVGGQLAGRVHWSSAGGNPGSKQGCEHSWGARVCFCIQGFTGCSHICHYEPSMAAFPP